MTLNNILEKFITLTEQSYYNYVNSKTEHEKESMLYLYDRMRLISEEVPEIIFVRLDHYPKVTLIPVIDKDLSNKELCDAIYDFCAELAKWCVKNGLEEIVPITEAMKEAIQNTILNVNIEFLN